MSESDSPQINAFDFDAQDAADLTPKEIRGIKWQGKEYVLKQATEAANVKYTNAKMQSVAMNDGKVSGLKSGGELGGLLVSLCLFEVTLRPDGTEALRPISEQAIRLQWPPRYVAKLFEEAKRISHIDQPDKKPRAKRIDELEAELAKIKEEGGLVEVEKNGDDGDLVGNSSGATGDNFE